MSELQQFIEAVQQGNETLVKDLLAHDPSLVEAKKDSGLSIVLLAAYYSHSELAQLLASKKGSLNIFEPAAVGDLKRVKVLVETDALLANTFSVDGFPPLGLACFFGHLDVAAYLLSAGAEVNTPSQNRMEVMPLHAAVANQHLEIARMLLENGALVNAVQQDSFTPLHGAAQNGQIEMIKLLLEFGADPRRRTSDGKTPLDMAEAAGHSEAASLLLIE